MKALLLTIPVIFVSFAASAQMTNKYEAEDAALYAWSMKTLYPNGNTHATPDSSNRRIWSDSLTKVCKARDFAKWFYVSGGKDAFGLLFFRNDTVEQHESRRERKKRRKHEQ